MLKHVDNAAVFSTYKVWEDRKQQDKQRAKI